MGASALGGGSQSGGTNAAFGNNVLAANTSGGSNTAMGYYTLASNTTGGYNVAIGGNSSNPALYSNTTGSYNTALGSAALQANTTASNNTAVGYQAGYSNTTGAYNAFFGAQSGYLNSTGGNNSGYGFYSLNKNTTGQNNNAFGREALYSNTTASYNSAFGTGALYYNTTGANNSAFGESALFNNTTASNNTAVGYQAGYANTTGASNAFIGYQAGTANTTGSQNSYLGYFAGGAMTTGSSNTIVGRFTGNQGGLDIRTASNRIVLSDGDGNPRAYTDSNGRWIFATNYAGELITVANPNASTPYGIYNGFSGAAPNNTSQWFHLSEDTGGLRFVVMANGGIKNYSANNTNLSDVREKTNFAASKPYLETICSIPVKTFNYIDQNFEEDGGLTLGVIAQEVQAVAPELIMESNWGTEEEPKMRLSIYQTDLQYALMKSIQELKAIVDAQAAEIAELKAR